MKNKGDITIHSGLYANANYYAAAVVAVVTEGIDWAAYLGGAPTDFPKEQAEQFVAQTGDKIPKEIAKVLFPDIKLPYRL